MPTGYDVERNRKLGAKAERPGTEDNVLHDAIYENVQKGHTRRQQTTATRAGVAEGHRLPFWDDEKCPHSEAVTAPPQLQNSLF